RVALGVGGGARTLPVGAGPGGRGLRWVRASVGDRSGGRRRGARAPRWARAAVGVRFRWACTRLRAGTNRTTVPVSRMVVRKGAVYAPDCTRVSAPAGRVSDRVSLMHRIGQPSARARRLSD